MVQAAAGTTLTFEKLREQLLMIETKSDIESTRSPDKNEALSAKVKFDSKKKPKEKRECYHCGKKGHLKRDFRKLKAEERTNGIKQTANTSVANSLSLMMA